MIALLLIAFIFVNNYARGLNLIPKFKGNCISFLTIFCSYSNWINFYIYIYVTGNDNNHDILTTGSANIPASEMSALKDFYYSTGGNASWRISTNWNFTGKHNPCNEKWCISMN